MKFFFPWRLLDRHSRQKSSPWGDVILGGTNLDISNTVSQARSSPAFRDATCTRFRMMSANTPCPRMRVAKLES